MVGFRPPPLMIPARKRGVFVTLVSVALHADYAACKYQASIRLNVVNVDFDMMTLKFTSTSKPKFCVLPQRLALRRRVMVITLKLYAGAGSAKHKSDPPNDHHERQIKSAVPRLPDTSEFQKRLS